MATFKEFLTLNNSDILLDSIKIFGLKNTLQLENVVTEETDFYIRTIKGKTEILPINPYSSYMLIAERVAYAKKITIKSSDEERGKDRMFSNQFPQTNANPKMPTVQTSNGRKCMDCSKASVCRYQEVVTEEVEKLIGELKKKKLPLSVNINCNEFLHKNTGIVR